MTNKLEIEINITKTTIERTVFVNGELCLQVKKVSQETRYCDINI